MSQTKAFRCDPELIPKLVESLVTWFMGENFKSQTLKTEEGFTLIQIEKIGGWRKFVGMSTALNVLFKPVDDNYLNIEIGAGRWLDKAASAAISMVILWPLLITAGVGAVQQYGMPEKIYGRIEYLLRLFEKEKPSEEVLSEIDENEIVEKV